MLGVVDHWGAKIVFDKNFDPYGKIIQLEYEIMQIGQYVQEFAEQLKEQARLGEQTTDIQREMARAIESLYKLTMIIDAKVKEHESKEQHSS